MRPFKYLYEAKSWLIPFNKLCDRIIEFKRSMIKKYTLRKNVINLKVDSESSSERLKPKSFQYTAPSNYIPLLFLKIAGELWLAAEYHSLKENPKKLNLIAASTFLNFLLFKECYGLFF